FAFGDEFVFARPRRRGPGRERARAAGEVRAASVGEVRERERHFAAGLDDHLVEDRVADFRAQFGAREAAAADLLELFDVQAGSRGGGVDGDGVRFLLADAFVGFDARAVAVFAFGDEFVFARPRRRGPGRERARAAGEVRAACVGEVRERERDFAGVFDDHLVEDRVADFRAQFGAREAAAADLLHLALPHAGSRGGG